MQESIPEPCFLQGRCRFLFLRCYYSLLFCVWRMWFLVDTDLKGKGVFELYLQICFFRVTVIKLYVLFSAKDITDRACKVWSVFLIYANSWVKADLPVYPERISFFYINNGEIKADCSMIEFMQRNCRHEETLEESILRLEREARSWVLYCGRKYGSPRCRWPGCSSALAPWHWSRAIRSSAAYFSSRWGFIKASRVPGKQTISCIRHYCRWQRMM